MTLGARQAIEAVSTTQFTLVGNTQQSVILEKHQL